MKIVQYTKLRKRSRKGRGTEEWVRNTANFKESRTESVEKSDIIREKIYQKSDDEKL